MKQIFCLFKMKYTISGLLMILTTSCCHIPLVDCYKINEALDIPKVFIDSTFGNEHLKSKYIIDAILFEIRKKKEYSLVIDISHTSNEIFSSENFNLYQLNNERIYSDKVVSFDPVNRINENNVRIWFFLSHESLKNIVATKNSFLTEVMSYNGNGTLNLKIPYHLEFNRRIFR